MYFIAVDNGGGDAGGGFGGDAGNTHDGENTTGSTKDLSGAKEFVCISMPEMGLFIGLLGLIGGVTVAFQRKQSKREKYAKKKMKLFAEKDNSWDEKELQKQVGDT